MNTLAWYCLVASYPYLPFCPAEAPKFEQERRDSHLRCRTTAVPALWQKTEAVVAVSKKKQAKTLDPKRSDAENDSCPSGGGRRNALPPDYEKVIATSAAPATLHLPFVFMKNRTTLYSPAASRPGRAEPFSVVWSVAMAKFP